MIVTQATNANSAINVNTTTDDGCLKEKKKR
jgi:hypothetical protein